MGGIARSAPAPAGEKRLEIEGDVSQEWRREKARQGS